jgi:hypothetical protein
MNVERKPHIPEEILKYGRQKSDKPLLRDLQEQHGGAGVFNFPLQGIRALKSLLFKEVIYFLFDLTINV